MALLLLMKKPAKAEAYLNLRSEDLWTSLLFQNIRHLDPDLILRPIINTALGREAIEPRFLRHQWVNYDLWTRMCPPSERDSRRSSYDGAFEQFRGGCVSAPEGITEADVLVKIGNPDVVRGTESCAIIEMKLRSGPSRGTTHDAERDQSYRSLDVLWTFAERMRLKEFFYILLDNQYQADCAVRRMRNPRLLRSILSSRTETRYRFEEVAKNVGWISYSSVYAIAKAAIPLISNPAEKGIAQDLGWLLGDLLKRSSVQLQFSGME